MVGHATASRQEIRVEALHDLRQALTRYGVAQSRCRQATRADEQRLSGLLAHAEEVLTTSAGRYARLEDGVELAVR
jgi:hypothetical protein